LDDAEGSDKRFFGRGYRGGSLDGEADGEINPDGGGESLLGGRGANSNRGGDGGEIEKLTVIIKDIDYKDEPINCCSNNFLAELKLSALPFGDYFYNKRRSIDRQ
jgi:hypothetical protein